MLHHSSIELSVVMPCLNEAETLETCILKAKSFFQQYNVAGEVVIADNGSTDGSIAIAERAGARVVHISQKGYGNALRGGILSAQGTYVVMGDSDDSYDFSALMPYLDKLRQGYELVMGNRFKGGIRKGAMPFLHYYLGNPVLSFLGRLFFNSTIGDFHCGLRAFSKDAFLRMNTQTTGMEFASEMVMKATIFKMKIAEVPTILYPDGRSRPPHLRTWRDGWRHLRFMLLYAPSWLFLYPGLIMMVIGLVLGSWIVTGPVGVGKVTLDVNTLVYMAILVLVGFQFVSFYFKAKLFAINAGLLPPSPKFSKATSLLSLELGLIMGILLIVAGMAGSLIALNEWGAHAYGRLNPGQILRIVIPSTLSLLVGVQVLLTSFFNSLLGLQRKAE